VVESARLVVIDPGHGGRNAGCAGATGVHEKQVTLAISKRLAGHLEAAGYSVVLTRHGDEYLTLRQRTRIANQLDADLFISIHANSSGRGTARGFESHVLSLKGTRIDTPALRRGEGTPRVGLSSEVAAVLDAVEHGQSLAPAAGLAASIQEQLGEARGSDHDRGVRQDSHHVLLGATMPAVLVEVGFLDHPVEGAELTQSQVQDRIARSIAQAVAGNLR
jgi:N-acetylmuramoyl-L-alanine amidase